MPSRKDLTVILLLLCGGACLYLSLMETLGWTSLRKRMLVISFPEIKGLKEGNKVTVLGMIVGEVRSIEFPEGRAEQQQVRVHCEVLGSWRLREGYSATVTSRGLIAIPYVDLNPGYGNPLTAAEEQDLYGQLNPNTASNLAEGFHDMRDSIRTRVADFEESITFIERGGGVGEFLLMREERDYLANTLGEWDERIAAAESTLLSLRDGQGFIGEALTSDSTYLAWRDGIQSADRRVQEAFGPDSWAMDEARGESLVVALRAAREFLESNREEDSQLARLLRSQEQADSWREGLAGVRGDIGTIVAGGNGFGEALNEPGLAGRLDTALQDARVQLGDVLAEVRAARAGQADTTEMSFARLIADVELRGRFQEGLREFRSQAREAREGLERARERADINKFGTSLLSAF